MSADRLNAPNSIDLAAARWVARKAAGMSPAELAEFNAWRAQDPRHDGSFLRALAIERLVITSQGIHAPQCMAAADAVAEVSGGETIADVWSGRRLSRRRLVGGAIAACLALAVAFAGQHYLGPQSHSTMRGEIRDIALEDGSNAVLNTSSSIAVNISSERRRIDLEEGEAWFDVAHDPTRPFEVRHGDILVRATGTAFQVSALPGGVDVLVTEGSVAILRDGKSVALAHVSAGSRFTATDKGYWQEQLDRQRMEQQLAWRQGMIVFEGETVAAAAEKVNRYNDLQIQIASPRLADERIYGTFRARDPEGLSKAVAIALDAQVERRGSRLILSY